MMRRSHCSRDRIHDATLLTSSAPTSCSIELLAGLFPDGDPSTSSGHRLPRLKDESGQAWTLNALANSYSLSGQPARAVPLFEAHNLIYERKRATRRTSPSAWGTWPTHQLEIGALAAAEANLHRSIALCREIGDEF